MIFLFNFLNIYFLLKFMFFINIKKEETTIFNLNRKFVILQDIFLEISSLSYLKQKSKPMSLLDDKLISWNAQNSPRSSVGKKPWHCFIAIIWSFLGDEKYVKQVGWQNEQQVINSRRTWELTQKSETRTSTKISRTLNAVTMECIMKTWWKTIFEDGHVLVILRYCCESQKTNHL